MTLETSNSAIFSLLVDWFTGDPSAGEQLAQVTNPTEAKCHCDICNWWRQHE